MGHYFIRNEKNTYLLSTSVLVYAANC